MIEVKNLHKYYNKGKKNEQHVLNDVSLELDAAGLVCILGESGSGKTTLLNTIGGLDTFAGGSIVINDTEVKKYDPKVMEPIRNDHFDYIFQNYYLLQDYSVAYNIKLALNRYDLTEEEKDQRVDYVLKMLGIEKYKKKQVSKLSGGQQQRVSIARALVKSPDVILADEPTGNLDEENTLRTMSILKNISKECLVLLVTHEKRIAKFFADRIIEVCDGRIVRDEPNNPSDSYERSDDSNIYLKELEQTDLSNEQAAFRLYTRKGEISRKIELNLAWKDGKLYIQNNMDCDILIEGVENGVQMLDEERPTLDMTEVNNFSYDLPKMESKGSARLGGREILRMAVENIQLMGKKQAFIIAILLVTAVLLSVTLAQFVNTFTVNESSIVTTDSHYVQMIFTNTTSRRSMDDRSQMMSLLEDYFDDETMGVPFFIPSASIYLTGSGYEQLNNLTQQINCYSFVSEEHLSSDKIIYGRMPQQRTEVVMDKRVIDTLSKTKTSVASLQKNAEDYVGMKLAISSVDTQLTVVGISDTEEPSIYCSQNMLMGINAKGYKIANLDEYREDNPDAEESITLQDGEILVRQTLYDKLEEDMEVSFGDDNILTYKAVGSFPDGLGYDYIMSDKACKEMRNLMIYENRVSYIYCENPQETYDFLQENGTGYGRAFTLSLAIPAQDQVEEYQQAHSSDMGAKTLIPIAIAIISLIMVYFTIKSNASSRSEELTVYRLIGISRGSILKAYMLEMVLVTSYTSLPAVLVTCGVIQFISSVPSLEIAMNFPWWTALLLLVCLYVIHALISIMPVYGILSKPPATLAVKE
jgi:ABC-type lipoprotein export system ATPase subunit/ABC-type antimicrobial peptide transport system permease subunit